MSEPVAILDALLEEVAMSSDDGLLLSQAASLGPAFALLDAPTWVAFGFGKFDDGKAPIRFAAAHPDRTRLRHSIVQPIQDVLADHATAARFTGPSDHADGMPEWLGRVIESRKDDVYAVDMALYVPRLSPSRNSSNALWMSRFLSAVAQFDGKSAGVVVMLRPAFRNQEPDAHRTSNRGEFNHSLTSLRNLLESQALMQGWSENVEAEPAESVNSTAKTVTATHGKEERSETRSTSSKTGKTTSRSWSNNVAARQTAALAAIDECARSGAWWCSVRCFADSTAKAKRVASLYWSCVVSAKENLVDQGIGLQVVKYFAPLGANAVDADTTWSMAGLTRGDSTLLSAPGVTDSVKDQTCKLLGLQGLDLMLERTPDPTGKRQSDDPSGVLAFADARKKNLANLREVIPAFAREMVAPRAREFLVSGDRLSTMFQLPASPSAAVGVVKGFDYCTVPRPPASDSGTMSIGHHLPGGLRIGAAGGGRTEPVAGFRVDDLTKHTLIVGATGSGKTTTVVSILRAAKAQRKEVRVAILEGAKREYRRYRNALGIKPANLYDLRGQEGYLALNLFDHPDHVTPETHVSQIAALFDATLDMPAPVPALMREALARAYNDYHDEPTHSTARRLHPIRFWLVRAALQVLRDADYAGEIASNVSAAIRTRLRMLSLGACGRVLEATKTTWPELCKKLVDVDLLVELEGIGDAGSRAFVMSLFVQYYRYALESRGQGGPGDSSLRNLLVLEEAHRIIGKPTGPNGSSGSQQDFGNLLGEVRAHGCGIIISDQSPSRLIDDAMRNTNTKFLMRLVSGDDIKAAVHGAGLPDEAARDIPTLKMGQAVLVTPDNLPGLIAVKRADVQPDDSGTEDFGVDEARRAYSNDERDSTAMFQALQLRILDSQRVITKTPQVVSPKLVAALERFAADSDAWPVAFQRANKLVACDCAAPSAVDALCAKHGSAALDRAITELFVNASGSDRPSHRQR